MDLTLENILTDEFKQNFKGTKEEYKSLVLMFENSIQADETDELLAGDPRYRKKVDNHVKSGNKKSIPNNKSSEFPKFYNAYTLYNSEIKKVPKLLDPFLQKVGLASIVGSSDTGKSTFLRQLALSVALNRPDFVGFKINSGTNKVIYISTEDDPDSTNAVIKMQLKKLLGDSDVSNLKNLNFIFEIDNILNTLDEYLYDNQHDLIILDAFADVFGGEINSNTQVRQFLNEYHKLAIKHNCLIIFLHHNGKRTDKNKPSKDNIIGSQAFEAKMRSVLNLSQSLNKDERNLTLVKCNFLSSEFKGHNYVLKFDENLVFSNTNRKIPLQSSNSESKNYKKDDKKIIDKVLEIHNTEKLSIRKIEAKLKDTKFQVSKSVIAKIIKENK